MKLILARHEIGQKDYIYYLISFARRSPISKMSPSVCSSFELEQRKIASGCIKDRLFFRRRISQELP
jgi:hypothetical protein